LAVARGVLAPGLPRGIDQAESVEIEAEIQALNDVLRMRRV
jgi:hypothetical protein